MIGPSGCGKSTFVRCLNRMHETIPDARATGRVRIGDLDVYNGSFRRRRCAAASAWSSRSPIRFPPCRSTTTLPPVSSSTVSPTAGRLDEIVEHSLRSLGAVGRSQRHAKKEVRRQPLRWAAAAPLHRPRPGRRARSPADGRARSALDPISTGKIEELIFQLKERYTIVIVTHNMQQAARVAEYTGFFLMGKLVEFDKTEKIFTNPSDKRTEDYITGRFG